jgi:hypothetical protein
MYQNRIIIEDIVSAMVEWCSIQPDIDEAKVKAANVVAQKMDIESVIGSLNIDRCLNLTPTSEEKDINLKELLIPVICFYTFSRLLKLFPGTFTDSGYIVEAGASDKNITRHTANDFSDTAKVFLQDVLEFLALENPQNEQEIASNVKKRVFVIGGQENIGNGQLVRGERYFKGDRYFLGDKYSK